MWETFGEDVYLTSQLGIELVKGYEGDNNDISDPTRVASCLKHYLGYSVPVSGKDRTPALIPEIELRERHLPAFKAAIDAGAHTVMVNSGIINGVPVHASYELLTKLLKEELGFTGLVVTDWKDIENLHERDKVAQSQKEAVKLAINAGIDMSMIPYNFDFCNYLVELVNEGEVPISRIDDAVRRILNVKFKLGLFERPVTHYNDYPLFGSEEFEQAAYQTAAESVTLLKNEGNILPLKKNVKVLVAGSNQYPFGFGLSYTTFEYSNLTLSSDKLQKNGKLEISVKVKNIGNMEGKETVLLYTTDLFASVTPDVKRLRGFEKINLKPGEEQTVSFSLTPEDVSFINAQNKRVTEPGEFVVQIAELKAEFTYVE